MKIHRDFTSIINWILDNLCPPILRDCYPLMYPIYRIVMGEHTAELLKYKDQYPLLTEEQYSEYYEYAARTPLASRPTDLNRTGVKFILDNASGTCLDVGCGRGYLSKRLAKNGHIVTGLDIIPPPNYNKVKDNYTFVKGSLDGLPFLDGDFETVICAHVLEHIPNLDRAVSELLRVTEKRLIIVLPRQREYRYVTDLHIRFFPYEYNVRMMLPPSMRNTPIFRIGADWGICICK